MEKNYSYIKFGDFAEIQPTVKISRDTQCGFIPMEVINPGYKYVYPIEEKKYDGSGVKFENNDIIFARITPCLEHGKIAVVKGLNENKGFGSSEYYVFRERKEVSTRDYIYYLAISPLIKGNAIVSMVGASGRQRAQKDVIEKTVVKVPDLPTQKKVSLILSTYDDLIDINRQRVQLLEESARLLFREWFVYFRFPGHEKVKIVDGVPEGWEKEKLIKIGYLNYGKALVEETREEGDVKVYGSSGVVGVHNKSIVEGPGIIVGRKGNVGAIHWVNDRYWPIDTVYYIKREQSNLFLYLSLKTIGFINTDASVPGLNRDYAHSKMILVPTKDLLDKFLNQVNEIYSMVKILTIQNQKLAQARDLLLPRLMSGAIEV